MRTFPSARTMSATREAAATRGDRQTPMKPGDEILIDGKLRATIRAIRTREQLREIAPLLSEALERRLMSRLVIRAAIVTTAAQKTPTLLIETAAGWTSASGESLTVVLRSEGFVC